VAKISHIGGQTSFARNIPHSLWVAIHAINYVKLELIDKVDERARLRELVTDSNSSSCIQGLLTP